jgi:hypothetical protein
MLGLILGYLAAVMWLALVICDRHLQFWTILTSLTLLLPLHVILLGFSSISWLLLKAVGLIGAVSGWLQDFGSAALELVEGAEKRLDK